MINTPYASNSFQHHRFDKTGREIRLLEIDQRLVRMDDGVYAVPYGVTSFPPFNLFLTKEQVPSLETDIVVDGRLFLKADNTPARRDIYEFYLMVATLMKDWMAGNRKDLLHTTDLLMRFYSQWFRNTVSGRMGLDLSQTLVIQAVGVVFFIKQFDQDISDDLLLKRAVRVIPGVDMYGLLDLLGGSIRDIKTLSDVMEWIREIFDSPRTSSLTNAYATIAFSRTWGPAFKEMSLAAVEYPPIFAAMCYHSIRSSGFLRTDLGQWLKKSIRPNDTTEYVRSIDMLLRRNKM